MSAVQKRRIVVGDAHGELQGFREILSEARLIDSEGRWSGGHDVLVQVGDMIDRGPASRESHYFIVELQRQAADAGGAVVRLCGNHELMLLQEYYGYVTYENPQAIARDLKQAISRGDVVASYTDGDRLYTHAGLLPRIRNAVLDSISEQAPMSASGAVDPTMLSDWINAIFKQAVERGDLETHPIFHIDRDRGGFKPASGIFWCDFVSISKSDEARTIKQVFGHTPVQNGGVAMLPDLSLINVDAGMCQKYGGHRVFLEIVPDGSVIEHSKTSESWMARSLSEAV